MIQVQKEPRPADSDALPSAVKSVENVPEAVRIRFQRLADEWKSTGRFSSSVTAIAMQPAYQQIIGLGPAAVPLILRELSREPHQWFWALKAITDADPVKPENIGIPAGMAADWLTWGAENGYSW